MRRVGISTLLCMEAVFNCWLVSCRPNFPSLEFPNEKILPSAVKAKVWNGPTANSAILSPVRV